MHGSGLATEGAIPSPTILVQYVLGLQLILSKLAKLDQLEQANHNVAIVSEPEIPAQIPETPVTKQELAEPVALLPAVPGVSQEDVKSVVDTYLSGIATHDICSHLRWGSNKYGRVVKPVLDAFLTK